jgi:oxygen-independent coproporphyrinogen-3 oxidase
VLIGLGSSSISETPFGYMQNDKHVETYRKRLDNQESLFVAGHQFTAEERATKQHIKNLMCRLETTVEGEWTPAMINLADDGLVQLTGQHVEVQPHARPFLRSVCAALDPLEVHRAATITYSSNL